MNKTPEQLAIQKAIVCLYLRKRNARFWWRRAKEWLKEGKCAEAYEDLKYAEYNQAYNSLVLLKRVLYHNIWD